MHSKAHKEQLLAEQLELRRIETFYPRIRVSVVNPRVRKVRLYFPGYVFMHVDLDKRGLSSMHYMPGSAGLIMIGKTPANAMEGLIHAPRKRVDEIDAAGGGLVDVLRPREPGSINSGPFAGYEVIFNARLPGPERVRVLLKLLRNRQLPVDLPAGQVRPKKIDACFGWARSRIGGW